MNFKLFGTQSLDFLLDINNRFYTHLLFWLVYYLYRVMLYIEIYESTPYVQFFELIPKAFAVYINFYVLMPLLLKKNKDVFYIISMILTLLMATFMLNEIIRVLMKVGMYTPNFADLYRYHKIYYRLWNIGSVVGITAIIKILKDAYQNQQIIQQLIQEKLQTELKFLRNQVNPHFFFNTLNNLYSLTLEKSEKAPEIVLKLSKLMDYMLYETNQNDVALEKEIAQLDSYIELEKLRFGEELQVIFIIEGDIQHKRIAPTLLIPFVENCFKHVSSADNENLWIKIQLKIEAEKLYFKTENAFENDEIKGKHGNNGIGIVNVQRRLELLYENFYTLEIASRDTIYSVSLTLDLSNEPKKIIL